MTIVDARQPPQDLEAEMSLLGAMLLDPPSIGQVLQIIPREDARFLYRPDHRKLYETLVDLYDQARPIDLTTLRDELVRRRLHDEVGGDEYLVQLTESVPSAANCEYYAHIVRDKAMLREVIACAGRITERAYKPDLPTAHLLDEIEKDLFNITEKRIRGHVVPLREILQETFRRIAEHSGHALTGVPTGFTELDDMTSGLQAGEMIIVAARPSMGKTALALSMAEHIAIDERLPCAVFSLEMSKQQVAMRLLSSRSGVEGHDIRRGNINADQKSHLFRVLGELSEKPIFVDDTPGMTVMELRAKTRRLKLQHDIKIAFVDYLQLLSEPRSARENRQQEISTISRGIKALARELEIPIVAMAQLNRDPEKREGNKPRMSDLRESGAIEQDADVVILLHREEYYQEQKAKRRADGHAVNVQDAVDPEVRGKAELIVAKQRNGPTGVVEVFFDKNRARFGNLAPPGMGGYDYTPPPKGPPTDGDFEPPPDDGPADDHVPF